MNSDKFIGSLKAQENLAYAEKLLAESMRRKARAAEDHNEVKSVRVAVSSLVGERIAKVEGIVQYSGSVKITMKSGFVYRFYHEQSCCEEVTLIDFEDDDVIGGLIVDAEEVVSDGDDAAKVDNSGTWTFYKIETSKGGIWMRWLGESNGCYSESVLIEKSKGE